MFNCTCTWISDTPRRSTKSTQASNVHSIRCACKIANEYVANEYIANKYVANEYVANEYVANEYVANGWVPGYPGYLCHPNFECHILEGISTLQ